MLPPGAISVGDLRRPAQERVAIELLTDAFVDFPAMQLVVGTGDGARARLQRLLTMELDDASEVQAIGAELEGRLVGVLTYLDSPRCSAMSAGRVASFLRLAGPRVVRAMRLFGRVEKVHPRVPHRHLPTVGVVPAWQSQGIGSALMRAFHERCDRDGATAYLETIRWSDPAKPSHEHFYRRLGYAVSDVVPMTDEWEVLTMIRKARGPAAG